MKTTTSKTLFSTLQGLGNSIVQWPVVEALNERTQLTLAVMNNGSSKFYQELGYDVVPIESRKDIILKLGLKKYDSLLTPCPSWKRECLASLVTLSNSKMLNIHSDRTYRHFLPNAEVLQADPAKHDLENTIASLDRFGLSVADVMKAKNKIKDRFYDEKLAAEKYVVLHPTASTQFKYYPKTFWVELAQNFADQGYMVYVISGPAKIEADFCTDLVKDIPKVTYLKNAEFLKLCALLRNCSYFLGLDSSIMHLAAVLDCNLVALWSFADFRRIYPYGLNSKIYLPAEVLEAKEFTYPKKELTWLNRARAQDVMKIIKNESQASFELFSQLISPVRCYKY